MLEYIQTFALVALLLFLIFIERTMRSKIENMPSPTGDVEDKISVMTEVLDDIADLLNDTIQTVAGSTNTHTPSSPMESILTSLISNVMAPKNHGIPQENQWPIQEINENPPEETTHQD